MAIAPAKIFFGAAILLMSLLHFQSARSQPKSEAEALIDQLKVDVVLDLEALQFTRQVVLHVGAMLPMCRDAPAGSWADPLGEAHWDGASFAQLRAGLRRCQSDYRRIDRQLARQTGSQAALYKRIVETIEADAQARKTALFEEIVNDPEGISHACSTSLYMTKFCALPP